MIRDITKEDLNDINELLKKLNYELTINFFDDEFIFGKVYEDKKICGVVIYHKIYERIEIDYIIVDDLYKNKGIGTKLLNSIDTNNIINITLEVRESNIPAINFYKKNGFTEVALRKNYYKEENGILMIKNLGE